jgi:NAD(P)-dependent dehydrogenase (short-subunit alcohol dehydrogenase family)
MLIEDKVVVISGGAGLIGQEFAKEIISQGGTAVIADIDEERMRRVSKEISQTFPSDKIDLFKLDISCKDSLKKCIDYVHCKYKKIDALINSAYPRNENYGKHFFDVEYDDFVENLGMNLGGCIISSQMFALYFQKQGYGNIINISSVYGVIAPKFEIYDNTEMTMPIEYAAIKSGMLHLTKYMSKYFKGKNIRVNAISPGGILDGQPKEFLSKYNQQCSNKGMLDASDLTGTLVFLISDMSMHINGQNIIVDDGYVL